MFQGFSHRLNLSLYRRPKLGTARTAKGQLRFRPYLASGRTVRSERKVKKKDLGVDTSGGGLRRIATARGRQVKAQNRKNKLGSLQVGQVKAQIRIFKGSIMAAGLYGHQAMGVAPKRLKWYRHAMAGLLGRQSLGGTDVILHYPSSAFLQFGQDCQKLAGSP